MTTTFDDLVEQLLCDVALSGSKGIGAEGLERAVKAFCASLQLDQQHSIVYEGSSFAADGRSASSIENADSLVNAVWTWLEKHPDIEIKDSNNTSSSLPTSGSPSQALAGISLPSTASASASHPASSSRSSKRIFTTPIRTWQILTGHGIDIVRVPLMQFHLLSIIAAHGLEGLLQPDLTKLAGQDKRSVPKRTDDLAAKGYISKERVIHVVGGQQTTLLKMKRFASSGLIGPKYVQAYPETMGGADGKIVYLDAWFENFVRLVKMNGGIIALADLRVGMGWRKEEWARNLLTKAIHRLVGTGMVRRLKAKVQDESGQMDEDAWVNCVQLLRDPTDADRLAFSDQYESKHTTTRTPKRKRKVNIPPQKEANLSEEDVESDEGGLSSNDSDKEDASQLLPRESPYSLRKLERPVRDQDSELDAVLERRELPFAGSDALLTVASSTEFEEWGFTKLRQGILTDNEGRSILLGSKTAARNPFRSVDKSDSSQSQQLSTLLDTWLSGKPKESLPQHDTSKQKSSPLQVKSKPSTSVIDQDYRKAVRKRAEMLAVAEINAAAKKRTAEDASLDDAGPMTKAPRTIDSAATPPPTDTVQATLPEESRILEIEADLLARSKPGAYIDPPECRRFPIRKRLGRPPKSAPKPPLESLVAVFKSEKLRDYPWFKEEAPEAPPPTARLPAQTVSITIDDDYSPSHRRQQTLKLIEGPKRRRGRPTKAEAAERERQRLALLGDEPPPEVSARPSTPPLLDLVAMDSASFDAAPAFSTRRSKLASSPLASKSMPAPIAKSQASAEATVSNAVSQTAGTNAADSSEDISPTQQKKRRRSSNAVHAENKRVKRGRSLIVKLPVPKHVLEAYANEVTAKGIPNTPATSRPTRAEPVETPDSNRRSSLMVTLPLPSTPPSEAPAETVATRMPEDRPNHHVTYSKSYTLQHPEISWIQRGNDRYVAAEPSPLDQRGTNEGPTVIGATGVPSSPGKIVKLPFTQRLQGVVHEEDAGQRSITEPASPSRIVKLPLTQRVQAIVREEEAGGAATNVPGSVQDHPSYLRQSTTTEPSSSPSRIVKLPLTQSIQAVVSQENTEALTSATSPVQDGFSTSTGPSPPRVKTTSAFKIVRPYVGPLTYNGPSAASTAETTMSSSPHRSKSGTHSLRDIDVYAGNYEEAPFSPTPSRDNVLQDSHKFLAVQGMTVRRTADGIAAMSNAELLLKMDPLEENRSRKIWKRSYAFNPKERLANLDTRGPFPGHDVRLLMYPRQVFHQASGTIGTVSITSEASARLLTVETVWKNDQAAPNYLQDVLDRAEHLGHVETNARIFPEDRFAREIERVEAWEESLFCDSRLMNLGDGPIFIDHGLDLPFPPAFEYLEVKAEDFIPAIPPFEENLNKKRSQQQQPKTVDAAGQNGPLLRQQSNQSDALRPNRTSTPSNLSMLSLRNSTGFGQNYHTRSSSVINPLQSDTPLLLNGSGARLYPGPDLPKTPLLSLAKNWSPVMQAPTSGPMTSIHAPLTPETSTRTSSSRSLTPIGREYSQSTDAVRLTTRSTKRDRKPTPDLMFPDRANTGETRCTTCVNNDRTCYDGSETERCAFCKATGSWCSRVHEDAERIQERMEQVQKRVNRKKHLEEGKQLKGVAEPPNQKTTQPTNGIEQPTANVPQHQMANGVMQSMSDFQASGSLPAHVTVLGASTHQTDKCGRCEKLGKPCIAGSSTERCGFCKSAQRLCSKVDVDRERLIKWGRYPGKSTEPAVIHPPMVNSADSSHRVSRNQRPQVLGPVNDQLQHDPVYGFQPQTGPQPVDHPESSQPREKRKRTYTYKAKEAAKSAAIGNEEEPFDQIFHSDFDRLSQPSRAHGSPTPSIPPGKRTKAPSFAEPQRLSIAVALVNMLCHGIKNEPVSTNWDVVAHALAFKYDNSTLHTRWRHQKKSSSAFVRKLQQAMHEPFLRSYEAGEIPAVDFDNLNSTDWPALVRWVEKKILPLSETSSGAVEVRDLPVSRKTFEVSYEITPRSYCNENGGLVNGAKSGWTGKPQATNYSPSDVTRHLQPNDVEESRAMIFAKSHVRAVAITKDDVYDEVKATRKLSTLDSKVLKEAIAQLLQSQTIVRRKADRQLPGRNYLLSRHALSPFIRWPGKGDEFTFLRKVAEARIRLVNHFHEHDRSTMSPDASDVDRIVIHNMVAQGHLKPIASIDDLLRDFAKDKKPPTFSTVYTKTPKFALAHGLTSNVLIPSEPREPLRGAIPFWIDIHGNLLDEVWDMVLRSILHVLVFKPGVTANEVEKMHESQLWIWEIEMVLEWMEKVRLAERSRAETKGHGAEAGGWRPTEWWYCAFLPEVAIWNAPKGIVHGTD